MGKILTVLLLLSFIITLVLGPSFALEPPNETGTAGSKSFISAESRVRSLAIKSENDRKSTGIMIGGAGGLATIIGISLASRSAGAYDMTPLLGTIYIAEGIAFMAMGAAMYLIPTGIENDYLSIDKVSNLTGEGKRERGLLAEKSLKDRSGEAANGRYWGAVILGGLGAMYLASGGSSGTILGLLYGGLAGYSWFNKSDVEKSYEEYLADQENMVKGSVLTPPSTISNEEMELLNLVTQEAR